jgi:hypothetical protein
MSKRKTLLSSSKTSSSERKISDPFIIIDNYKFTAIRYISLDVRYQIVVNIKSELLLNGSEENFWIYKSNSELGIWRLCIIRRNFRSFTEEFTFTKGDDYVQTTLIHIDLQLYVNKLLKKGLIPEVFLNEMEKDNECVCFISSDRCFEFNDKIYDVINDTNRIIKGEPFETLVKIKEKNKVYCGHITNYEYEDNERLLKFLRVFSQEFSSDYDIVDIKQIGTTDFLFEESIHTHGKINRIHLRTKVNYLDRPILNDIYLYTLTLILTPTLQNHLDEERQLYVDPKKFNIYSKNVLDICRNKPIKNRTIHSFPFLLTPITSQVNEYGIYTQYIPTGIYICKLFDYANSKQCSRLEIITNQCCERYAYIGNRYVNLFPITYLNKVIRDKMNLRYDRRIKTKRTSKSKSINSSTKRKILKEHRKKREHFKKNKSERNEFIKNALETGLF